MRIVCFSVSKTTLENYGKEIEEKGHGGEDGQNKKGKERKRRVCRKRKREREREEGGKEMKKSFFFFTSFSIFTLALMPSRCSSFWLSSSDSTAALYCPLIKFLLDTRQSKE
jgi:hypothetical protein